MTIACVSTVSSNKPRVSYSRRRGGHEHSPEITPLEFSFSAILMGSKMHNASGRLVSVLQSGTNKSRNLSLGSFLRSSYRTLPHCSPFYFFFSLKVLESCSINLLRVMSGEQIGCRVIFLRWLWFILRRCAGMEPEPPFMHAGSTHRG